MNEIVVQHYNLSLIAFLKGLDRVRTAYKKELEERYLHGIDVCDYRIAENQLFAVSTGRGGAMFDSTTRIMTH